MEYRGGKLARVDCVVIAASHTEEAVAPDGESTTDELQSKAKSAGRSHPPLTARKRDEDGPPLPARFYRGE